MRNILFLILLVSIAGCTHHAATSVNAEKSRVVNNDERIPKSHMEHSFKDLSAVMAVVMLTVDGDEYGCKIQPDQLAPLSQSLKAVIDERFAVEKQNYLKLPAKQRLSFFPKDCKADCSCSAYANFMEFMEQEGVKFKKAERQMATTLAKGAEELTQNSHVCADQQMWVCESKMFRSLLHAD